MIYIKQVFRFDTVLRFYYTGQDSEQRESERERERERATSPAPTLPVIQTDNLMSGWITLEHSVHVQQSRNRVTPSHTRRRLHSVTSASTHTPQLPHYKIATHISTSVHINTSPPPSLSLSLSSLHKATP